MRISKFFLRQRRRFVITQLSLDSRSSHFIIEGFWAFLCPRGAAAAQLPEEGENANILLLHLRTQANAKINKKQAKSVDGGGFLAPSDILPRAVCTCNICHLHKTRFSSFLFSLSSSSCAPPPIRIQCGAQLTTNLEQTKALLFEARIFMLQLLAPLFLLSRAHTKRFELWWWQPPRLRCVFTRRNGVWRRSLAHSLCSWCF